MNNNNETEAADPQEDISTAELRQRNKILEVEVRDMMQRLEEHMIESDRQKMKDLNRKIEKANVFGVVETCRSG